MILTMMVMQWIMSSVTLFKMKGMKVKLFVMTRIRIAWKQHWDVQINDVAVSW